MNTMILSFMVCDCKGSVLLVIASILAKSNRSALRFVGKFFSNLTGGAVS
uniref:Uncharacterized protein n=1 Tax=Arundo donax TaxID=35708 RepID=A0A0A9FGR8_ARUDO